VTSPSDAQQAWVGLRRDAGDVEEHRVDGNIWRILVALQNFVEGDSSEEPSDVLDDWDESINYLNSIVLPNMKILEQILLSHSVLGKVSESDQGLWTLAVRGKASRQLLMVRRRLVTLFEHGQTDLMRATANDLLAELEWWNRFFFTTHRELPNGTFSIAFLAHLAKTCPSDVLSIVARGMKGADFEWDGDTPEGSSVFCSTGILRDIVTQFRVNAEARTSGAQPVAFSAKYWDEDESIFITLRSSDTSREVVHEHDRGPGGLSVFRDELRRFGGDMEKVDPANGERTFAVRVSLRKWREV
jgi:hypothetical protein